ncbi:DNA-binding GntR family transcriptional regulator [Psychrobacter sp. PL15]|jgi:DNA-binding GntR family transcriptional regulator|uniref:GntR family transcriptional regulator n=1 Tax=unclassified Psychrobacter TaxID=196806 RepID=UPI001AE38D95|nr:GntR family transcriptional regulator [Psychrobacter sp. PL15]MEC5209889.1 DNA-binding GntR family transcriptional regulator [Psychrobacter sp. PL15]
MNTIKAEKPSAGTDETPEQAIISSITAAVSEQRLPAGTKLGEQMLSDIFKCNRANVRRALSTLATMHVVQLQPNKGAFVSTPSPKEACDVFEARRTIERTLARSVIKNVCLQDLSDMRDTITAEANARAQGDKPAELRLSRIFHMHLAKIADNQVLERFLSELTLRTTLIIGLYNKVGSSNCAEDEHLGIVQALEAHDEERFILLIDQHLNHLESGLDFQRSATPFFTLAEQLTITSD